MKKVILFLVATMMVISLFSCNTNPGSQFIGKWDNIDPDNINCLPGDPTSLIISKDGDLFIIDVTKWSSNGRWSGKVFEQKAYTATFKDGSLEISDGFGEKIDFAESSGHIFFKKFEFSKVN